MNNIKLLLELLTQEFPPNKTGHSLCIKNNDVFIALNSTKYGFLQFGLTEEELNNPEQIISEIKELLK